MLNFKLPDRLPPSIIAIVFLAIGFAIGYLYCENRSGKTESDALYKDAQSSLTQRQDEIEAKETLRKQQEKLNERYKHVDYLNIPIDDSLMLWQAYDENRSEPCAPDDRPADTDNQDEFLHGLRERIQRVYSGSGSGQ